MTPSKSEFARRENSCVLATKALAWVKALVWVGGDDQIRPEQAQFEQGIDIRGKYNDTIIEMMQL